MAGRTTTNVTKGQMTALLVMALVMGGGGLGLGAYAISTGGQDTQGPAGPQGPQGLQGFQGDQGVPGEQGPAGMVGFVVGIIDPNNGSTVSGIVSVRAMLWNSTPCTFKVLVNGHENATEVPWQWNTSAPQFGDGWWNLTVQAINSSGYVAQDQVLVQVLNHPEQDPVYYCSSQAEITAALADIGAGAGTVIITQNLSLTASIAINGGGSYLIEGVAPGVTVDCGGDRDAFDITSAASCTIRGLSIDAGDLSNYAAISVEESLTSVEGLLIFGTGNGYGISLDSPSAPGDLSISNCRLTNLGSGIYGGIYGTLYALHILDTSITHCDNGVMFYGGNLSMSGNTISHANYGVSFRNANVTCENNLITACYFGMEAIGGAFYTVDITSNKISGCTQGLTLDGGIIVCQDNLITACTYGIIVVRYTTVTIQSNTLQGNLEYGIYSMADDGLYVANTIVGITSSGDIYGIYLSDCDSNVFTGNMVKSHVSTGGTGYGLFIDPYSNGNFVADNVFLDNDTAIDDSSGTSLPNTDLTLCNTIYP